MQIKCVWCGIVDWILILIKLASDKRMKERGETKKKNPGQKEPNG